MSEGPTGLVTEPLFVGLTRPAMRWGATYIALLTNAVITMEVFLLSRNLLLLLLALPIHGLCMLLCARDARFFELALLWTRTRVPALFRTHRWWGAASYSPLTIDLPNRRGRRRGHPRVYW